MIRIHGLNKTTLLDYPGHVAATIFLGRCNFRCPFCHNGGLVLNPDSQPLIPEEEVLTFLKKRIGILTGVCITGGEPTLEPELLQFIRKIKEFGYLVKLDTNGYKPEVIEKLLAENLLDYIAMDVKNSLEKYGQTAGAEHMDTEKIKSSIQIIMNSRIPYELRTTVVKEFHTRQDLLDLAEEIKGAKAYFLQGYKDSEQAIQQGFHSYEKEELEEIVKILRPIIPNIQLRGID
ncbi:pyruvate formate lyase activating enzyme [Kineothrix alysoides]|uniref:Pyruvate formate lyase activating enzyme n=1 Tax=Kineothrix alysoides TaxID=1469948 RepID=A0A4R1QSS9_9FIRM|nr:anaerobic ribonucleoside-triphosphate reductase activating protein [Kineothrix alysoides]TCL56898.1 pyruvate formate lyase activating enzyme [Kineothrix alysoides]